MNQLKEDIQSGEKEEESLKAEIRTMKAEMEERSRKKNQLDSKRNQARHDPFCRSIALKSFPLADESIPRQCQHQQDQERDSKPADQVMACIVS